MFGESKITEYTVQENPMGPGKTEVCYCYCYCSSSCVCVVSVELNYSIELNQWYQVVIQNKQHYKVLGKPVDLTSLIRLQLQDGKVVKHEDWYVVVSRPPSLLFTYAYASPARRTQ